MNVLLLDLILALTIRATIGIQYCTRITSEVLGNTTVPSRDGLIAERLAVDVENTPNVLLLDHNLVCEGINDRYKSVSVVADYSVDGNRTLSQFEFACNTTGYMWVIVVNGSTANTVTTPADATLNTTLRTDCSICISPMRSESTVINEQHCEGRY